jgi:hypothetical protein
MVFRTGRTSTLETLSPDTTADETSERLARARYLTDGVNLYRVLGAIRDGASQMMGLENCRSLEVILYPLAELGARSLRPVTPAGAPA